MGGYAWVTLATNDAYSLGALVLAHSLRRVGTKYELVVLVTPGVTNMMREKLAAVFSLVQEVNVLDSKDEANLALLARPELGITFTKLHCWRLTQYEKCVFVDADTLVVRNCDELFEREELSAAPDVGWPDCFNSGVFVFRPSQQTFASITSFAATKGSFDGGDQGLLNMYFNDWARKDISKHLPFIYNMCSTATYSYLPAFKQFGEDVRIIHFIGITKPWLQYFDTLTGIVQPPVGTPHLQPLLQLWWNIFCDKVHPQLSPAMAGLAGALAQMTLGQPRSAEQIALEEHMRKQSWEQGQIDYMGRDSFDNIWKKICETLSLAPPRQPSPPKTTSEDETKSEKTEDVEVAKVASTDLPVQSEANDDVDSPAAKTTTDLSETQSLICKIPKDDVSLQETCVKHDSTPSSAQSIDTPQSHIKDESVNVNVQSSSINEKTVQLDTVDLKAVSVDADSKKELSQLESKTVCEADAGLHIAQTTKEICMEATTDSPSVGQSSDQTMVLEKTIPTDTVQDIVTKEELGKEVMQEKEENVKMPVDVVQESSTEKDIELSSVSASEVMFTNPVPIQVAESVLQTEPKESVTQEAKLITEEVITSTVAPVQEAVVASSETLVELTDRTELCDPTLLVSSNEPANVIEPSTTPSLSQNGGTIVNGSTIKLSESDILAQSATKHAVEEIQSPQEEVIQSQKTEILSEEVKLTESSPVAQEQTTETVEIKKDMESPGTTSELKVEKLKEVQEVKEEKSPDTTPDVPSELKTVKLEETQEVKEEKGPDTTPDVPSELKTVKLEEAQEVKEEKGPDTTPDVPAELKTVKLEEAQEVKEEKGLDTTSNVTSELKTVPLEEAQEVKETESPGTTLDVTSELKQEKVEEIQNVKQDEGLDTTSSVASELKTEKLEEAQEVKETAALLDTSKPTLETESTECPIRPTRTKELTIPSTPTVTEPTPPTSPIAVSTQDVENQGKTVKKTVKKVAKKTVPSDSESAERADTEGTEKKTAKKVVKKVVKKPKEGQDEVGESSSSTDKPKKTAKGTKKLTKPSQSLETDTSIPETPPPGSSDAPVPPKRKVKASTSTKPASTAQKPDTES